jgi:ABC-type Fe3+/spermidine/putrescine transport system ATPase subunit
MNAVALDARDLTVRRGDERGGFELRVDELALSSGEVLAVLGPNGAGKSTLLRALAGLEQPACGNIDRRADGPVTMVFQRPIVFAGSVEHNLHAALLGLRLSRDDAAKRSRESLERFGIARFAKRRAATLSGGETRRLALARAFALRPAVLLLDEPFDDLDAAGQESLSLDLRRAIVETRVAVAVVTHDLRRALLLADRIAILESGRLKQCDAREQVLNHPVSPDVARVVGMSNLIAGEVGATPIGEVACVEVDARHRIPVPGDLPFGTPVWVGIRPEHLKVEVGRGEGVPIGEGNIRHIVSDGMVSTVSLDWAGLELRTHLIAGRGLARTLAPRDSVTLSVRPEDVHLMERGRSTPTSG